MKYLELKFSLRNLDPEILIARLSGEGFESFQEDDEYLLAYISEDSWRTGKESDLVKELAGNFDQRVIDEQNWNETWESNFTPIVVRDCMVRASFHKPSEGIKYDIIIDPKMSFGTGHHETTYMMIDTLLDLDLTDTAVLDAGCGTGILSILAEQKGATRVLGFDIDEWAVTNANENILLNDCAITAITEGTIREIEPVRQYDVILANIHKNVLLDEMTEYVARLNRGGLLVLSGFYNYDLDDIDKKATESGLIQNDHKTRNKWCCSAYQLPQNDNLRN